MTPLQVPRAPAAERVRIAYQRRHETDYEFDSIARNILFIIGTCGVYGYIVDYQLMKRDRDHQRRALELLEGANEYAWEQANARELADDLRPGFERIAGHLTRMRHQTTEFRDPGAWIGIIIGAAVVSAVLGFVFTTVLRSGGAPFAISPFGFASGFAGYLMYILIDSDYVKHDLDEGAIQAELSEIYTRLGEYVPPPDQYRVKGRHNYVGRVIASIVTCGIYHFWWTADLMREGNWHMYHCWQWEDGLAGGMSRLSTAPAAPAPGP